MASNCMRMLLRMTVICGVFLLSGASPKRGHEVEGGRRSDYLSMHMHNGTIGCFYAQKTCRANKDCWRAMRGLHKTCLEKNGQCNLKNIDDLVKCADIKDALMKDVFPKERCSCDDSNTATLAKCFDIGNKIYSNPCFDNAKARLDAMKTTTPSSVVNDVTNSVSKDTMRHQFIGTVDGRDVEEASIVLLREKGMFPTTTAITKDPKKEVIVPAITTVPDVDVDIEFIQEEVNVLSEDDVDEIEEYDYVSINVDVSDEESQGFGEDEVVVEKDVEIDEGDGDFGSFFKDGIDLDSNFGIDEDFVFHKKGKTSGNKNYRHHPMDNVVTVPTNVGNSPKVDFSNKKISRGVNRPIEVKSSLLFSDAASQNTPQDVSMSNKDYNNMRGIDFKIIGIICGTLLAMFITASLVFVAYIRTHGQPSYVSGKKVKTKDSTPNKRQIVGNLA